MSHSHKKHILIVEDSQDLQMLLSQLLETENYVLSQAYDGKQALSMLHTMEDLPSLILLDVMMPVMGGIEFLQERLSDPKIASIPVIVMTADSNSKSKAALLCANEFVQKPINDVDELLETIHRILGDK